MTVFQKSGIVLCVLLLVGCATASVARYPNAVYPPSDPNAVSVYTNFPPVNYEVIGEVEGSGDSYATWEDVSTEMRKKAAEIGGTAVIIQLQDTPFVGSIDSPGTVTGSSTGFRGSGYWRSNSSYAYNPPTSTPLYGKYARGVVIRYR